MLISIKRKHSSTHRSRSAAHTPGAARAAPGAPGATLPGKFTEAIFFSECTESSFDGCRGHLVVEDETNFVGDCPRDNRVEIENLTLCKRKAARNEPDNHRLSKPRSHKVAGNTYFAKRLLSPVDRDFSCRAARQFKLSCCVVGDAVERDGVLDLTNRRRRWDGQLCDGVPCG